MKMHHTANKETELSHTRTSLCMVTSKAWRRILHTFVRQISMQCKIARCKRVLHVTGYRKILFSTLLFLKTLIKKKYLSIYSVLLLWTEM